MFKFINPKNVGTITKTKISPKVVFGVIVLIGLIAGSLIVTSLVPGSNIINLSATTPKPVIPQGWCYTGHSGDHMSKVACISLGTDNNPNTNWYAFCPDISGQPPRNADKCNVNYTDMQPSPRLLELLNSRETVINALNDGNISAADAILFNEYAIAIMLGYECTIYFPSFSDPDPTKKNYESFGITGTGEFIQTVGKLFSHMVTKANNCELLPPTCSITRSVESCTCNSNPGTSAHCCGQAVDIGCSDLNGKLCDTNETTRTKVAALISKIRGAGPVNVIRECYAQEKKRTPEGCGDATTNPIVHFDIKSHGNTSEPCVFENCDFNTCK